MAILEFDRLNQNIVEPTEEEFKQRAMPYEEFFGEMALPENEIQERIESARSLEDMLLYFLTAITVDRMYGRENKQRYEMELNSSYLIWLAMTGEVDNELMAYADDITREIVRSTMENIDNPWFTSADRAAFIAENEAQTSAEYRNWKNAILSGKKRKTWKSKGDRKVRKDHRKIDGKTLPIAEPFFVGEELMMYPKDINADPRQTVNCRCVCRYS